VEDLVGDGWAVVRDDVSRDDPATVIKQTILAHNNVAPLTAIYCLGHVPVPYSGDYNPDGHANHKGAWPADGYYGDLNGSWTDSSVNNTTASQTRNHNIPNDGKFDQSFFGSDIELQVGRVDFANMTAFSLSETELLRQYLNKSHAYKMGEIQVQMKAIIDDNFGGFNGEAFAASAWKNFAPLLHPDNVTAGDYRGNLDTASYIWVYGCGGGSFSTCNGIGSTAQLAGDSLQGIFSCMFGSYFGDWDSNNNILRAPLAQGTILTNCWSGRPHWYFHHMGMGENIGYSTRVSMNNSSSQYNTPLSFLAKLVGMGLMGDPSLRMYILESPSNLTAVDDGENNVALTWTEASTDVLGYYIYRSSLFTGEYELLNESPILGGSYIDACIDSSGTYYYQVRATRLQETPSGSYYNLSQSAMAQVDVAIQKPVAGFTFTTSSNLVNISNISTQSTSWIWSFGDGSTFSGSTPPTHVYTIPGDYDITLIVSNGCFQDTFSVNLLLDFTGTKNFVENFVISVSPNPGDDWYVLESKQPLSRAKVQVFDADANKILDFPWETGKNKLRFSMKENPSGIYFIQIRQGNKMGVLQVVKK